jgi:hypothetical protein
LQALHAMQHGAMHCNALQCTAMHCNALQCTAMQGWRLACNPATCNDPSLKPKKKPGSLKKPGFCLRFVNHFTGASPSRPGRQENCSHQNGACAHRSGFDLRDIAPVASMTFLVASMTLFPPHA